MYRRVFKRVFDVILSALALIVLSPVFLVVATMVRIKLGSPVVFKQQRPGKGERLFDIYKFRTMTDAKDAEGVLLPDEARLTSFGKALRSTSLDELPELLNILKGDMSIVGPRPLLVEYLPRYNAFQRRRHEVRPGLTGLAQINGRNSITWEEKFAYDICYVNDISFLTDCRIVAKTIGKVFAREGIGTSTADVPDDFMGTTDSEEDVSFLGGIVDRQNAEPGGKDRVL